MMWVEIADSYPTNVSGFVQLFKSFPCAGIGFLPLIAVLDWIRSESDKDPDNPYQDFSTSAERPSWYFRIHAYHFAVCW